MLFLVTTLGPNIINGILFVMFLILSMSNNSQLLPLWRVTIIMVALVLCAQYGLRVFANDEYLYEVQHHKQSSAMCLSGLIRCEDADLLNESFSNLEYIYLKLYLPYIGLLMAFILGHFILTSANYQRLME